MGQFLVKKYVIFCIFYVINICLLINYLHIVCIQQLHKPKKNRVCAVCAVAMCSRYYVSQEFS